MLKVAIIDDDDGVIEALQAALDLWEYQSEGIRDSSRVIPELKRIQPDLIFLDLLLSGTDGAKLTELIRGESQFANVPIVLMSAHPTAKEISKKIRVNGFLPKPFTLDSLQQTITDLTK